MDGRREKIRFILNICIAVTVPASWLWMFFGSVGELAVNGIGSLKYFTVLSNFMAAIAAVYWLACRKSSEEKRDFAERFKYFAAVAVMLTFTVVVTFLGPLYGYINMFIGANLFFHLLVPVAAALEIVFLCDRVFTRRENRLAVIAPLIYGIVYLINIRVNGMGTWPDTNDWYLFFAWGYPVGFCIYAVIMIVTWLLAFGMRKGQQRFLKGMSEKKD